MLCSKSFIIPESLSSIHFKAISNCKAVLLNLMGYPTFSNCSFEENKLLTPFTNSSQIDTFSATRFINASPEISCISSKRLIIAVFYLS